MYYLLTYVTFIIKKVAKRLSLNDNFFPGFLSETMLLILVKTDRNNKSQSWVRNVKVTLTKVKLKNNYIYLNEAVISSREIVVVYK